MPGSCNSGFRSRPSRAAGISRSNGLETVNMNKRNPTLTRPITPKIRARIASGRWVERNETATIQMLRINIQSSNEPSCAPQMAARR